jgi:hypothetical protein
VSCIKTPDAASISVQPPVAGSIDLQERDGMSLEPGDHVWYWNGNLSRDLDIPRASWFPGSNPHDRTDYLGNGKDIYNFVIYESEIARGRPQMRQLEGSYAWLNNNPGNITGQPGWANFGAYPDKFNWHHFLIFPSWESGYDAIAQLLRTAHYVDLSITDALSRYAPASDGNDPVAYAAAVAAAAGADPHSATIRDLDDAGLMYLMQDKITEIEGVVAGYTFAYDDTAVPEEIRAELP